MAAIILFVNFFMFFYLWIDLFLRINNIALNLFGDADNSLSLFRGAKLQKIQTSTIFFLNLPRVFGSFAPRLVILCSTMCDFVLENQRKWIFLYFAHLIVPLTFVEGRLHLTLSSSVTTRPFK